MKITWEYEADRYTASHVCFAGPYPVGRVWYDSLRDKGDPLAWVVKFDLPARKGKTWTRRAFATVDEAKAYLASMVKVWTNKAMED